MKFSRFSIKMIHCNGKYFNNPGATPSGPLLLSFMLLIASSISVDSIVRSVSRLTGQSSDEKSSNCSVSPGILNSAS